LLHYINSLYFAFIAFSLYFYRSIPLFFFFLSISLFLPISLRLSLFSLLFSFLSVLFVPYFCIHLSHSFSASIFLFVYLFVAISLYLFLTEEMQLHVSVCGQQYRCNISTDPAMVLRRVEASELCPKILPKHDRVGTRPHL
jgi:hypothetical protein